MDKVAVLQACPLLEGFTEVGLRILAGVAAERRVPAGAFLFAEGDPSDRLVVLAEGAVALSLDDPSGARTLATVEAPAPLGELALLRGGTRLIDARARTECSYLEITREDFLQLQRTKPQAALKLLMAVVGRFGELLGEAPEDWRALLHQAAGA